MNTEFIDPFLSSMSNVLVTMASLSPRAEGIALKTSDLPPGDITGLISLSSPQMVGTLALSFSEPVILYIAEKMLGQSYHHVNEEVADLVGELANMVSGGAKNLLETKGYFFEMATPVVIRGKGQCISHAKGSASVIIVPFSTEAGEFFMEVSLQQREPKP